ncbi:MAG TPA: glycosyltransferase, partial [Phycisphaerae bacterium]|nr:glycosyltransferase [Phycisphaerae bacterium]
TLLVIDDDVIHRMGILVRHLCVGMIDESVLMTVLSRSASPLIGRGVGVSKVVNVPSRSWPWRRPTSESVLHLLGGQKPDIVHCMSTELADWVHPWSVDWESVLVAQLSDLEDVERFAELRPEARMMGLAISSRIEHVLLERAPEMREQVRVVSPGLPAESEPAGLAEDDCLPTAVVTVPLTRHCGLEVVLKALRLVVREGLDTHLFILSTGKAEWFFRRQVDELELRSRVTFAGQLSDWAALRKAMMAADFFIDPGGHRRYTISALAALAGGLIVLAPRGTAEDYLIDGTTAALYEPDRHKHLAERWIGLLKDRPAARQLAQSALAYARENLQASAMVGRTAALYRQLSEVEPAVGLVSSLE